MEILFWTNNRSSHGCKVNISCSIVRRVLWILFSLNGLAKGNVQEGRALDWKFWLRIYYISNAPQQLWNIARADSLTSTSIST